ncbi:PP-loop family-domain-containing protein [Cytidiella melzeri]|nr:PP-loop family-domain-containing protein [Cytidiella melzeri]
MRAPPIRVTEFLQLLQRCRPPGAWPKSIAVANSGGPDSMCLLYLLAQTIKQYGHASGLPTSIYSVHVDHCLQPANEEMKKKVSDLASVLDVQDVQRRIPWGRPPYPPRPLLNTPFEELARDARSRLILKVLQVQHIKCVAYGHHADDQVETVLMRLMRGSGQLGASGMRRLRRWGMGSTDTSDIRYAGVAGMKRWIIRPFLEISKDRILATCEANGIDYVMDPSNFQPDATLRNYIRRTLATRETPVREEAASTMGSPSPVILPTSQLDAGQIRTTFPDFSQVEHAIHKLQIMTGTNDLKEAVRRTNEAQCRLDMLADQFMRLPRGRAEPSTYVFDPSLPRTVVDPALRQAIVRKILLYVSPMPWGSPAAEAHGSQASLERIVRTLWDTTTPVHERKKFSAGAKVLWTPVMKKSHRVYALRPGPITPGVSESSHEEKPVWIAHRAPPSSFEANQIVTHLNIGAIPVTCVVLWDNRFCITVKLDQLAKEFELRSSDSISISADTRWLLPFVRLNTGSNSIVIGEWSNLSGPGYIWKTKHQGVTCNYARKFSGAR